MYVYTERKKLIFKELTHAIIGIGKSNICREGQQAEDLGKGKCCRFWCKGNLKAKLLFPPGSSTLFLVPDSFQAW